MMSFFAKQFCVQDPMDSMPSYLPNNQFCVQEPFAAPAVPPPAAAEPAAAQQQKKIRRQSLSIRDVNLKSNDITLKT